MSAPTGIEALVCADITARQRFGIEKYGCTVEESPDDMLQHAYEESLDLAVYLKAEIERRKFDADIIRDAWRIISVLRANQMDGGGEPWPEALFWMRDNERFRPNPGTTPSP